VNRCEREKAQVSGFLTLANRGEPAASLFKLEEFGDLAKVYEKVGDADRAGASLEEAARKQKAGEGMPERRN
jgi:hypothetical protein